MLIERRYARYAVAARFDTGVCYALLIRAERALRYYDYATRARYTFVERCV